MGHYFPALAPEGNVFNIREHPHFMKELKSHSLGCTILTLSDKLALPHVICDISLEFSLIHTFTLPSIYSVIYVILYSLIFFF